MSEGGALGTSITCDECGNFAFDPPKGDPHCRTYEGRDVCVSCLVDLKRENGDYKTDE